MTVKIKKLTPPQIAALREALPSCVEAGVLTTTNSIATFNDGAIPTFSHITRDKVYRLLQRKLYERGLPDLKDPIVKVLEKLEERPDLVEEVV